MSHPSLGGPSHASKPKINDQMKTIALAFLCILTCSALHEQAYRITGAISSAATHDPSVPASIYLTVTDDTGAPVSILRQENFVVTFELVDVQSHQFREVVPIVFEKPRDGCYYLRFLPGFERGAAYITVHFHPIVPPHVDAIDVTKGSIVLYNSPYFVNDNATGVNPPQPGGLGYGDGPGSAK
jgi:hypothetical protein